MKEIKNIKVKVFYELELGHLQVPNEVYEQLAEIHDKQEQLDFMFTFIFIDKYDKALMWLRDNIKEKDARNWYYEIEDLE